MLCGCYNVEVRFINLTPHPVIIVTGEGEEIVIPPSGQVARVATTQEVVAVVGGSSNRTDPVRGDRESPRTRTERAVHRQHARCPGGCRPAGATRCRRP
jgi:hypothetical protein